jgi:hypothetical protein
MRKRRTTRSEETAQAFTAILAALDRYWRHESTGSDDIDRLLAAVIAHRKRFVARVTLEPPQ